MPFRIYLIFLFLTVACGDYSEDEAAEEKFTGDSELVSYFLSEDENKKYDGENLATKLIDKFDKDDDSSLNWEELDALLEKLKRMRTKKGDWGKDSHKKRSRMCLDTDNDERVSDEEIEAAKSMEGSEKYYSCMKEDSEDRAEK